MPSFIDKQHSINIRVNDKQYCYDGLSWEIEEFEEGHEYVKIILKSADLHQFIKLACSDEIREIDEYTFSNDRYLVLTFDNPRIELVELLDSYLPNCNEMELELSIFINSDICQIERVHLMINGESDGEKISRQVIETFAAFNAPFSINTPNLASLNRRQKNRPIEDDIRFFS